MSTSTKLINLFLKVGAIDLLRNLTPNTLTVLNYHRIDDPSRPEFNTFKPNVSATSTQFARQMDYLSQKYNVISGRDVADWISGRRHTLPPNAALVTFDDGYYDNLQHAYPVLKARNIPAIIFLTTDYIESSQSFYWDIVAYCFDHTPRTSAEFPLLGNRHWGDAGTKKEIMDEWITLIKSLPESDKKKQVDQLPDILDASVPDDLSAGLTLAWSDVRHLQENGIEMGSHTVSHPILTRIPLDQVQNELEKSKIRIEAELKTPVISFAYPNGQSTDFNNAVVDCVRKAGYQVAYTLLPGPTRYGTVKKSPFTIRRIFLSHKDSFSRYIGKLMGMSRLRP